MSRLPAWFKQEIPDKKTVSLMRFFSERGIHTVCRESKCPNFSACLKSSKLTFMILGDTCTRTCGFCNVNKLKSRQRLNIDYNEPYRIAQAVKAMSLRYVVLTSVTRDDLADGGAGHFARTIELIRRVGDRIKTEALIPDFSGSVENLKVVINAGPSVLAHNLETVSRLYKKIRPQANYKRSLKLLASVKALSHKLITKSSLVLGFGEKEHEVVRTMRDLQKSSCDIITLGQYLAPSEKHYPVKEFINPQQFDEYRQIALGLGFKAVLSGPLVRSSYQAEKVYHDITRITA